VGRLLSVNVGRPQILASGGGQGLVSAIVKAPVEGRVRVEGVNVAGDDQADRRVHGGPDKAAYAYASEDTAWWEQQLEVALGPGVWGENLTTAGLDVTHALIGERWRVGSVELEVCQPRIPCAKLGTRFGEERMVRYFARAGRPGAYLRIVCAGELGAGDAIEVVSRPDHDITVGLVARAVSLDKSLRGHVVTAPQLAGDLRERLRPAQAA
jgi:MOSC domain-containing protein YiiM